LSVLLVDHLDLSDLSPAFHFHLSLATARVNGEHLTAVVLEEDLSVLFAEGGSEVVPGDGVFWLGEVHVG